MTKLKTGYAPYITDEAISAAFKRYDTLNGIKRGPEGHFYNLALNRYKHGSPRWLELTAHMAPPAPLHRVKRLGFLLVPRAELATLRARLAEAERDRDRIERQAVGRFILASALTYSLGAWSGVEVVADMLKCAGITKDEVDEQGWHQRDRKKLFSMIDQARAAQSKERE